MNDISQRMAASYLHRLWLQIDNMGCKNVSSMHVVHDSRVLSGKSWERRSLEYNNDTRHLSDTPFVSLPPFPRLVIR